MPDSVIGRSKIHENQTRLTYSLIALFNIDSQFDNLLDSRATASKSTLLSRQLGSGGLRGVLTGIQPGAPNV